MDYKFIILLWMFIGAIIVILSIDDIKEGYTAEKMPSIDPFSRGFHLGVAQIVIMIFFPIYLISRFANYIKSDIQLSKDIKRMKEKGWLK